MHSLSYIVLLAIANRQCFVLCCHIVTLIQNECALATFGHLVIVLECATEKGCFCNTLVYYSVPYKCRIGDEGMSHHLIGDPWKC